jgi:hypothetical protein
MKPTQQNAIELNERMLDMGYPKSRVGKALGVDHVTWWRWLDGFATPSPRAWREVLRMFDALSQLGPPADRQ